MITPTRLATPEPSFRELFTPKLVTVFREGYDLGKLRTDALAGLTVAIVAQPLSMAIAVASGTSPERGATRPVRHVLLRQGLRRPVVRFAPSVADARIAALHSGG